MARRRKQGLTPEDREIWDRVAASVTPLPRASLGPGGGKAALLSSAAAEPPFRADPPKPDGAMPPAEQDGPANGRFRIGISARPKPPRHDLVPPLPDRLAAATPGVDGAIQSRLKRGKLRPEARIDLHGMTLAEAYPELVRFLHAARADDKRLVLVITGKGKHRDDGGIMPTPRGVLRHQVPHWVQTGALAQIVVQITPAHFRHGGEGAYYVYLRRRR
ncbi:MAG: Smr/MutS family protein [Rhodobacteraceae bacterium]|nr:Smr/MutS family protein [Paracoccaceae bacterium]